MTVGVALSGKSPRHFFPTSTVGPTLALNLLVRKLYLLCKFKVRLYTLCLYAEQLPWCAFLSLLPSAPLKPAFNASSSGKQSLTCGASYKMVVDEFQSSDIISRY